MEDQKDLPVDPRYVYGRSAHGEFYACSVTGSSHTRTGIPCQDAYGASTQSIQGQSLTFLALADGHGSEKHDLSEFGSRLAVTAALETMREIYRDFYNIPKELIRSFKQDLPRLVVRRWREAVLADARQRNIPIPEEDKYRIYTRYGTTLLVTMITPETLLFGQIGDGDILIVQQDGKIDLPFTFISDEMLGNVTYSLSHEDAARLWVTAQRSVPTESALLLMCTDGLSNCFGNDETFHNFGQNLLTNFQKIGLHTFSRNLPLTLENYSGRGSGDDISVALMLFHGDHKTDTQIKKENEEHDSGRVHAEGGDAE